MIKQKIFLFGLALLAIFELTPRQKYLRWMGHDVIPYHSDYVDEIDYPFIGYTLRTNKIATGWSMLGLYQDLGSKAETNFTGTSITKSNQEPTLSNAKSFNYPIYAVTELDIGKGLEHIIMAQPYIDHPPIAPLIFSLKIDKIDSIEQITSDQYRTVSVYLSILTTFLIYIFSSLLSQKPFIGLISALVYSQTPVFILASRYSLLENVLVPISLIAIIFSLLYAQSKKNTFLIISGLFVGFSLLTKLTGIFTIPIILMLTKTQLNKNKLLLFFAPIILTNSIYYGYLFYLSPQLPLAIFLSQASRASFVPLNFIKSISQLGFNNFPKEGFWLFGLISILLLPKKYNYLKNIFFITLLSIIFLSGSNYPWYYLPLIPIYCLSISIFISRLFSKPKVENFIIFLLLPLSSAFFWGFITIRQNYSSNPYRILLATIPVFLILTKVIKNKLFYFIFLSLIFFQFQKWNYQSFQYIIGNWRDLPADLVNRTP